MNRIITYEITENEQISSVGSYLRSRGFSRHVLSALKRVDKGILLNGLPVFTSGKIKPGDILSVKLPDEKPADSILPKKLDFSIVYEDEDILVINKPADMPVHPSNNNYENTLANGIAWYYQENGISAAYHCINRLDRDTTGLLILAKHMLSASILSGQMKNREIKRTYMAIVEGIPCPYSGTVSASIARVEGSVIERCVDPSGEAAITHYRVLKHTRDLSLVELHLETGRTHQIRVHMKYIGHPLLGDFLYNPLNKRSPRQTLHSAVLSFRHPISEVELTFHAPLPGDMACLIPYEF